MNDSIDTLFTAVILNVKLTETKHVFISLC